MERNRENCTPASRGSRAVKVTAAILFLVMSLILGALLLMGSGDTRAQAASGGSVDLMGQFDMVVGNAVSDSLEGVLSLQKSYWLSDDVLSAPRPNPEYAGTAEDPSSLQWLIDGAEEKLGVTDLLFSTDTEILPDTEIRYYLDDTIVSVSWKQRVGKCVYSFNEVKVAHPSQFRRFLSGGEYGSGVLYTATDMANSVNAVSAASGDYYSYRPGGISVYNGQVCRATAGDYLDTCFIDDKGDLLFAGRGELIGREQVEAFVAENNIRFSLAFGPILLRDGENVLDNGYSLGEINRNFSRAALCQQGPLHYITVTANTGPYLTGTPTMREFAGNLEKLGIRTAYALDGGQTATLVANGEIFNNVDYGQQRLISDIIYFATAIPDGN